MALLLFKKVANSHQYRSHLSEIILSLSNKHLGYHQTNLHRPILHHVLGGNRKFGIFDRIQDKMMEKQATNEAKQMRNQFKEMAATEKFDLNQFSKQLEEGTSSWLSKIPGIRSQPEVEKITKMKNILDAMTEQEKAKPKLITRLQRQRIAEKSAQSEEEVEDLLHQFEKSQLLHKWLRKRVAQKKRIPRSQEELMELASATGTQHQFLTDSEKKMMQKMAPRAKKK
mmetsp:Transcript_18972/g.24473  ORF Transcript_18972/g.24473 Transcript_18972/m.24473 type:complete len:227 (+) Transcript_18972:98-778(+)